MSIFSRFSTMIKSNINDLISRAEDPEKMLNQIIVDMRDQLAKAKREVAGAIADERKLQRQLADASKERQAWEKRAMLAVQQGRDDLAKQALVRQQEHAEQAAALEQTWQAQAAETENLKGSLRQLNDKIEEAKAEAEPADRQAEAGHGPAPDPRDHVRAVRYLRLRGLQPHGGEDRGGGAAQPGPGRGQ